MQRDGAMLERLRSGWAARRRGCLSDASGAVMTEYAVVVGVCGIVISLAIASLGIPLVSGYGTARTILISTVP
jgi:Flp pilus assembly pilin Flp